MKASSRPPEDSGWWLNLIRERQGFAVPEKETRYFVTKGKEQVKVGSASFDQETFELHKLQRSAKSKKAAEPKKVASFYTREGLKQYCEANGILEEDVQFAPSV